MTQPQAPTAQPTAQAMQYLLSHGCVTTDQLSEVFSFTKSDKNRNSQSQLTDEKLNSAVNNLNNRIKMFNMMVRSAYDPNTRKRYHALISTVDNDITRKASHHNEKEFEYFRLIWEKLQDEPCRLGHLHMIGKDLKLPNCKDLIDEWSDKHWLYKDGEFVKLGIRSELELDVLKNAPKLSMPTTSGLGTQSTSGLVVEGDEERDEEEDDDDSS